jgi:hypothetical protein
VLTTDLRGRDAFETIAEQDTVLLGRVMYEEWVDVRPMSKMEPFAARAWTARDRCSRVRRSSCRAEP